jgi:hypothetical protein
MTATESLLPEIINDFFNKICHLRTHATAKRRARVAMILLWQVLWADLNCSNKGGYLPAAAAAARHFCDVS